MHMHVCPISIAVDYRRNQYLAAGGRGLLSLDILVASNGENGGCGSYQFLEHILSVQVTEAPIAFVISVLESRS